MPSAPAIARILLATVAAWTPIAIGVPAWGAGFAHNPNFIVYAPADPSQEAGQALAQQVLAAAETYRREIAATWLGEELPPGVGRTVINVSLTDGADSGLTWANDRGKRRFHTIYLTSSREAAAGSTLKHEMVHAVLATQWSEDRRLPGWAEEGIASRYDDDARIAARHRLVTWFADSGNWPSLELLLAADSISSDDLPSYAAAASLAEFLLSEQGKATYFRFAQLGSRAGWSEALQQCYGIEDVRKLQSQWQAWAESQRIAVDQEVELRQRRIALR